MAVTEAMKRRVPLDDVMEELARAESLSGRDEALARAIAIVTFRRLGTLGRALSERLNKAPKDERLMHLLATGAAQILFLDVPDHGLPGAVSAKSPLERARVPPMRCASS